MKNARAQSQIQKCLGAGGEGWNSYIYRKNDRIPRLLFGRQDGSFDAFNDLAATRRWVVESWRARISNFLSPILIAGIAARHDLGLLRASFVPHPDAIQPDAICGGCGDGIHAPRRLRISKSRETLEDTIRSATKHPRSAS